MNLVKKSQVFALVSMALCLGACMDIRAVDRQNKNEDDQTVRPMATSAPWEIERTGEFNEYRVVFKGLSAGVLSVERELVTEEKDGASTKVLPLQLGVAKGRAMDSQVEGGKIYRYHWIDADTGERVPGKTITVKVPLDLKIDQEVTPDTEIGKIMFSSEKTRPIYGKIIFLEKGVLTTRGHDLIIEADVIEGEKVLIRTFAPEEASQDKVNGGEISISAGKAIGDFHFELSGRQGLKGVDGKKPGPELNGKEGRPGRPGSSGHNQIVCSPLPIPGGRGQDGNTGYPGGPGGNGGDTAKLILKIEESSQFHRTFAGQPGRGGEGGLGGEGGAGGPGGRSGKEAFPCQPAYGPSGNQGDRGRHGDWGLPGKESPIFEWRLGKMEEIKRGDEP